MEREIKLLDKENSTVLKGIAAVGVMLGHCVQVGYPFAFYCLNIGPLWVGVFFMLSGYGLECSAQTKKGYLKGFMPRKIAEIWLPFAIAEAIYIVAYNVINGWGCFSKKNAVLQIVGIRLANTVLWYVIELLFMYFLYYIWRRALGGKQRWILWFLYIAYLLLCIRLDIHDWWYLSTIMFPVGIEIFVFRKRISDFISKRSVLFVSMASFAVLLSALKVFEYKSIYYPTDYSFLWHIRLLYFILVPVFCITIMCILQTASFRFAKLRKAFSFLGKISFEIYLYHQVVRLFLSQFEINLYFLLVVTLISGIAVAEAMHYLNTEIVRFVKGRLNRLAKL